MNRIVRSMMMAGTLTLGAMAADKQIVFIAGDRSHGSGEHEFNAGCLLLAKALNEQSGLGVHATVVRSDWPTKDRSVLEKADGVVIYCDASSAISGEWEYLDGLAQQGKGLMFMHYAVHPAKPDADRWQRHWVGATMEDNYSVNPHWVAKLQVDEDHPIARGLPKDFEAFDEFYYNMRFQEDREKVMDLVTAVPSRERMRRYINMWDWHGAEGMGKEQTLMWGVQRDDGGRGVGFVGGHYHKNWALDRFRTVVLNAIVWVSGMDVPEGGVKSLPVSEDQLNENLDIYPGQENPRLSLPDVAEVLAQDPAPIPTDREKKPE
ncbi:type 1 glutamine amidotransferase [Haloferula luteola]|uniref:Type 1 glutamine amidotransferase n=1 Tax=Haloferula luteola TaxID=595692 RepID=A0A840V2A5_9BACT|nr:ThuA domain-containing protein [Haloferula luteola]MBB5349804.1 type 1 glutamine amidotransferase [Haloferula luteola]